MCCPFIVLIHDRDPVVAQHFNLCLLQLGLLSFLAKPDNIAALTALFHTSPFSFSWTLISTTHFTQFSACSNVLGGASSPLFHTLSAKYLESYTF